MRQIAPVYLLSTVRHQRLAALLAADVWLPCGRVGGGARHDDFHRALVVIGVMPCGAELHDGVVKGYANASAHTDDHCLALHDVEALLKMFDEVLSDEGDALFGPSKDTSIASN